MSLSAKLRRGPMRIVTGAFIVNSGIGKLSVDDETAKTLHGMATGTYGVLDKVDPKLFAKGLAAGEIALGGLVLAPIVSPVIAGAALVGFSGALLNMWWNTPGMHDEGSLRPTPAGVGIAKDVWMLGIGVGLIADGVFEPAHDKKVEVTSTFSEKRQQKAKQSRRARKHAKASAKHARAEAKAHAVEFKNVNVDLGRRARKHAEVALASAQSSELSKRARKAGEKALASAQSSDLPKRARKSAEKASELAAKRLSETRDEYGPVVAAKATAAREAAKHLADEYGPVVAAKASAARDAAKDLADEYGPVVAAKASAARDAAKDLADEYGPVVAAKASAARDAAQLAADRARKVAS